MKNPFTFTKDEVKNWQLENDVVMGGNSDAEIRHEDDSLVFSGHVSVENNGGFAQVKRVFSKPQDFSDYDCIQIAGAGDAKTYELRLATTDDGVNYRHEFEAAEDFSAVLSFADFSKTFHGEDVPDKPDLNLEEITEVSVLIGNGREEDFEVHVLEIFLTDCE